MRLPNFESAIVDRRKVLDYLLNSAHPDNGGKSRFFASLGFTASNSEELIAGLHAVAAGEVTQTVNSDHGDKYVIDGVLRAPDGRASVVRTIWILDRGNTTPRLVTAYPRE